MVAANPARVFDYGAQIGMLRSGSETDVSIFELRDGRFDFEDSDGVKHAGQKMLANNAVVRRSQLFVNAV
jgi:predicted amidohydrolase